MKNEHPCLDSGERLAQGGLDAQGSDLLGAQQAFQTFNAQHNWMVSLARGVVQDPSLAEDVAQDAFVAALVHRPQGLRSAKAWLGTLVRNFARESNRTEARRRARDTETGDGWASTDSDSPADIVARAEAHRHLVAEVLGLDEVYRDVLLQRYLEGWTPQKIAARNGLAVQTVSNRLTRAHGMLRRRLDQSGQAGAGHDASAASGSWASALLPFLGEHSGLLPGAVGVGSVASGVMGVFAMKWLLSGAIVVLGLGGWWLRNRVEAPNPDGIGDVVSQSPVVEQQPLGNQTRATLQVPEPEEHRQIASPTVTGGLTRTQLACLVQQQDGLPLADVAIVVLSPSGSRLASCKTDPDGRGNLSGLFAGTQLSIEFHREGVLWLQEPLKLAAQTEQARTWQLNTACQVRGQLVDQDGVPIPDESVVLGRAGSDGSAFMRRIRKSDRVAEVLTDSQGFFVFEQVDAGAYIVGPSGDLFRETVRADGKTVLLRRSNVCSTLGTRFRVQPNQAEFELELTAWIGLELRGEVRYPDGSPAGDVDLVASLDRVQGSLSASSRSDGRFRFEAMAPGDYTIYASSTPDGWGLFELIDVEVAGGHEAELSLSLKQATELRGRAARSDNGSVVDAWVTVQPTHRGTLGGLAFSAQISPHKNGAFDFENLAPGSYDLIAQSEDDQWAGVRRGVEIGVGSEPEEVFVGLSPAATLGLVANSNGEPWPSGSLVSVESEGLYLSWYPLSSPKAIDLAIPPGELKLTIKQPGQTNEVRTVNLEAGDRYEILPQ